jgi:2-isopropylmalate synthase
MMGLSTATIELVGLDGAQVVGTSVGTGLVDASYKAVDTIAAPTNQWLII